MSKRRYTEAQMIGGLKQVEARASGRGCGAGTGSVEAHALRLEDDMRCADRAQNKACGENEHEIEHASFCGLFHR